MSTDRRGHSSEADETQPAGGKRSQHDSEFYRTIGKKGGDELRNKIGPGGFRQLGQKGGAATKSRYGSSFYKTIGQKGGLRRGKNHPKPVS